MIPTHAKKVFSGVLFDVYQWEQELFDGSTSTFEMIKQQDTVQILAIKDETIMIQEQEQPGGRPFLCLPGGRIELGEEALAGAKRELLEETGFASERWSLYHHREASGHMQRNFFVYLARDCDCVQQQQLDPGERIHVRWVSLDALIELVDSGMLTRIDDDVRMELIRANYHEPQKKELIQRLHMRV